MENYSGKKQYENLSEEQNNILQEINELLTFHKNDPHRMEKFVARQKAAMDFEHEMQKEDIEPKNYILFHRIIGSTPHDDISEFDTPDRKIEEFIKKFYHEFDLNKDNK